MGLHTNTEARVKKVMSTSSTPSKAKAYEDLNTHLQHDVTPPDILATLALQYNETQSPDSTFAYALALCKSDAESERRYGINLCENLLKFNYEHTNECLYAAALVSNCDLIGDLLNSRHCDGVNDLLVGEKEVVFDDLLDYIIATWFEEKEKKLT